jgi:beta-glucosidase
MCAIVSTTGWGVLVADTVEPIVAMRDGAQPPFTLMLGDKGNWALPVVGEPEQVSEAKALRVEPGDEGSVRVTWRGKGEGQVYLQAYEPMDYSALAASDAALVLLMKVDRPPKKKVLIRMGCVYPCRAEADVTGLFKAVPKDTWGTVSFAMRCFQEGGLNVTQVDSPLILATDGKFSLSLAEVSVVPGMGANATVRCGD